MGFEDPLEAQAFDLAAMGVGEELAMSMAKRTGAFPVIDVTG